MLIIFSEDVMSRTKSDDDIASTHRRVHPTRAVRGWQLAWRLWLHIVAMAWARATITPYDDPELLSELNQLSKTLVTRWPASILSLAQLLQDEHHCVQVNDFFKRWRQGSVVARGMGTRDRRKTSHNTD